MDKIQNPLTKRWIQRDNRTHRFLQRKGVLPHEPPRHARAAQTSTPTSMAVHDETGIAYPDLRDALPRKPDETAPHKSCGQSHNEGSHASQLTLLETESTLPRSMVPFVNNDKGFHESWYPKRDLLDIPHPFRMVLLAKPNGGKTTFILNVILRIAMTSHPFRRIVIVHCDPDSTKEYDDLEHESL